MDHWHLLSLTTFLPLVGAVFVMAIRGDDPKLVARNARAVALLTSLATFILSLLILVAFNPATSAFQLKESASWLPSLGSGGGMRWALGVDGISIWFVLLSTFLTPICILASVGAVRTRVKEYMIAFLVLETMTVGMFLALDLVLFYVFFEGVLIPMFLIIGVWGGPRRTYAVFKFFLFTLAGSVLMLVAMMTMYYQAHTTDIRLLMAHSFPLSTQIWLWVAFFASFAVKLPMWPVHTWLPDAYTEAPTTGSVIMMLLKMGGGYGFLRFSLTLLPQASAYFTPAIYVLSVVAVIYISLVTLVQTDMKKLIAYSSIAHMGFVTAGVFSVTTQGVEGALLQMLSQGIITAALFLCAGVVYDRVHTMDIARFGGLASRMPKYAAIFMIFILAAAGLPGTSGFVGEFLVLVGLFKAKMWVSAVAATGMVLSAAYMLYLYRRVVLGKLVRPDLMGILDMSAREIAVFAPLLVVVLWMGVYPATFLRPMQASVSHLVSTVQIAEASPTGMSVAQAEAQVKARAARGPVAAMRQGMSIASR